MKNKIVKKYQSGFTFVEIVVIAPIVILAIGAFIAVVVSMTTDVLTSRAANVLTYNVQDALNRIQQDVKLSTTFLAQSNVRLDGYVQNGVTHTATNQGYNDDTTAFNNAEPPSTPKGQMLILNALATTGNPINNSSQVAYLNNKPNACGTDQAKNTPLTYNVVYYVKNSSLWRRTILPDDYASTACNAIGSATPGIAAPWQQPSCTPTTSGTFSNPFCVTSDQRLVDGVEPSNFNITYFSRSSSSTANTVANTATDLTTRQNALSSSTTVSVSIDAIQTVGGKAVEQSSSIRTTRLDTNASTIGTTITPTTPSKPAVSGTLSGPAGATFSWPVPTGNGTMTYTADYQIDTGSWTNILTNSTATSFTVNPGHNHIVNVRVTATNSANSSPQGTATLTIPLWANLPLQNNWTDYLSGYSTAAFTKTSDGMVVLKGLVRGGTATSGTVIGNLPVGYRPSELMIFGDSAASAGGRVNVDVNGDITYQVGNNAWQSLDGINFMPSGTTFTSLSSGLSNGWSYFGSPYETPGYATDTSGRVHLKGMTKGGTTTDGTKMTSFPSSLAPSGYEHVQNNSNNTGCLIGIGVDGTVQSKSCTNNSFTGMNALFYPATYPTGGSPPNCINKWCSISFQNGWGQYPGFSAARYTKSADGMVLIKGLINAGTVASGTVITHLPAGYCPKQTALMTTASNGAWARVDVNPASSATSGCDVVTREGDSNAWLSLDALAYPAEW
jgi:hypothetical protein